MRNGVEWLPSLAHQTALGFFQNKTDGCLNNTSNMLELVHVKVLQKPFYLIPHLHSEASVHFQPGCDAKWQWAIAPFKKLLGYCNLLLSCWDLQATINEICITKVQLNFQMDNAFKAQVCNQARETPQWDENWKLIL